MRYLEFHFLDPKAIIANKWHPSVEYCGTKLTQGKPSSLIANAWCLHGLPLIPTGQLHIPSSTSTRYRIRTNFRGV